MKLNSFIDWTVDFNEALDNSAVVKSKSNYSINYNVVLAETADTTPSCTCGKPRTHQTECVHIVACMECRRNKTCNSKAKRIIW